MSWSVVTTVAEPSQLVCAFVAHHLQLGAQRIHLFLDTPNPGLEALLAQAPRCEVTVCDTDYWAERGGRPWLVTSRQKLNAQQVYNRAETPWLLHIDADEFLADPTSMERAIADAPKSCCVIRLPVAERAWPADAPRASIFAGVFRIPAGQARRAQIEELYGADAGYLNAGVKAYAHWKSLTRTGYGLTMGIHTPQALPDLKRVSRSAPPASLLHYDGLTRRSWVWKMHVKAAVEDWRDKKNLARSRQLRAFTENRTEPQPLLDLLDRIEQLTPRQMDGLEAAGLLARGQTDPIAAARELWPAAAFSFTPEAFDRAVLEPTSPDIFLDRLKRAR